MSKPVSTGTPAVPRPPRARRALERWAAEHPDRVGMIGADGRELTWAEIAASTRTLTGRIEQAGAGTGRRVAVMAGRSRYALSSLLAIWASGASAVLLDELHPIERLRWVTRDAGCSVVVSSEPVAADLGLTVIETAGSEGGPAPEDASPTAATSAGGAWASREPESEAYVVYTSGTTGRPKGVRVGFGGLENFLAHAETLGYRPGSRAASVVSPGFDGWLWSVLTPFVNGVTCVALDAALENLRQDLIAQQVDNLCMTPSLYAAVEKLPQVEVAVVAGEFCPDSLVARLRQIADRVINVYGPTETTIAATMADTGRGDDPCTIGRALPGYHVTVVDDDLVEVPPGVSGEVLIGGPGVALGYVGARGEQADRFVGRNGARRFRTGDLGVLGADGQLRFLGRCDNQVKIGGFRVELEEVERIACRLPDVKAAVAYVRGDPGTLALGVRTVSGAPLDEDVRSRLASGFAARLPRQLCPTYLHHIAEVPLEPTGKVSRREVAALGEAALAGEAGNRGDDERDDERDDESTVSGRSGSDSAPDSVLDGVLAAWSGVFGRSVTEDCDFFADGGHSLLAAQLASRLEARFGVPVSIPDVLTARTPRALADRIDETRPQ